MLPITVNGSLCSAAFNATYPNKPCVSVTVCTPGTSTCQTINDILLDTGSYGLRIFNQVLTVPLTQVTVPSGNLANCVQYVDGSADWGPVQSADVVLGGEPAVTVPIQVINASFGTVPAACGTPDASPAVAGFNGILGVGLFAEDCGPGVCKRGQQRQVLRLQRVRLQRDNGSPRQPGPEPGGASSRRTITAYWCSSRSFPSGEGFGQRPARARDQHPGQQRTFRGDCISREPVSRRLHHRFQRHYLIPAVSSTPVRTVFFSAIPLLQPVCESTGIAPRPRRTFPPLPRELPARRAGRFRSRSATPSASSTRVTTYSPNSADICRDFLTGACHSSTAATSLSGLNGRSSPGLGTGPFWAY